MSRIASVGLAIALALMAAACAGPAGEVAVLQSGDPPGPGATVAWAPVAQDAMRNGDPRIDNDIVRQRIRTGVETALAAKGYRFVQTQAQRSSLSSIMSVCRNALTAWNRSTPYPGSVCGWRG